MSKNKYLDILLKSTKTKEASMEPEVGAVRRKDQ